MGAAGCAIEDANWAVDGFVATFPKTTLDAGAPVVVEAAPSSPPLMDPEVEVAPNELVAGAVVAVVPNILGVAADVVGVGCPNSNVPARAAVDEDGSKMDFRFAAGSEGTVVSRFKLVIKLLLPGADVEALAVAG